MSCVFSYLQAKPVKKKKASSFSIQTLGTLALPNITTCLTAKQTSAEQTTLTAKQTSAGQTTLTAKQTSAEQTTLTAKQTSAEQTTLTAKQR